MTETLAPLHVSDVHDDSWWETWTTDRAYREATQDWLRANGVEPDDTYRWELYLLDTPFLKVFTYDRDHNGQLRFRRAHDAEERQRTGRWWMPLEREPYLVPVSSLPPRAPSAPDHPQEAPDA